jgi:hypothetical protein
MVSTGTAVVAENTLGKPAEVSVELNTFLGIGIARVSGLGSSLFFHGVASGAESVSRWVATTPAILAQHGATAQIDGGLGVQGVTAEGFSFFVKAESGSSVWLSEAQSALQGVVTSGAGVGLGTHTLFHASGGSSIAGDGGATKYTTACGQHLAVATDKGRIALTNVVQTTQCTGTTIKVARGGSVRLGDSTVMGPAAGDLVEATSSGSVLLTGVCNQLGSTTQQLTGGTFLNRQPQTC